LLHVSKLSVYPDAENINWPTDSVIGWIDHMLIVEGKVKPFDNPNLVIYF